MQNLRERETERESQNIICLIGKSLTERFLKPQSFCSYTLSLCNF